MISETEVEAMIADEILGMIKSKTNVKTFCKEYHIDRRKLAKSEHVQSIRTVKSVS